MNQNIVKLLCKAFVVSILILTMTGCGSTETDRYNKYMKIVENDAKVFDIVANIQTDSIVMNDDGTMSFNSVTDEGVVIPFVASNVTYENGSLIFKPRGKVDALKSVGQIYGYHALVSDPGSSDNTFEFYGSYTFSEVTEVDSVDKLTMSTRFIKYTSDFDEKNGFVDVFNFLPNYIGFCANPIIFEEPGLVFDEFTVSSVKVYYNTDTYTTGIKYLTFNEESFGAFLEGTFYNPSKEGKFDSKIGLLDFYLIAIPDVYDENEKVDIEEILSNMNSSAIYGIEGNTMKVGDLKDAQGNVLDKDNTKVEVGMTLDIHFGESTHVIQLPVVERYEGAMTLSELIPYTNLKAIGDVNALVIPINWSDEEATDEELLMMKEMVGRVSENGTVVDYTDDTESLSSYFDKSSYGKLNITSYFTDWYQSEFPFDEVKYNDLNMVLETEYSESGEPIETVFYQDVMTWLNETQTFDKELFDKDNNNLYDVVVFINAGDLSLEESYAPMSFTGAYAAYNSYTAHGLTDGPDLGLNTYLSVHTNLGAEALIHEFGHQLGLVDYYDVTYSGYDAVGGYDMQSINSGDWNPYSKYAVGWTTPIIVEDLAVGEFVDIEIGSFAKTGDTIVIPAAGVEIDGPFNEYIMVDLLTDEGLSTYQVDKNFIGIQEGQYGVRIYHVNSVMERRDLQEGDSIYPVGTTHYTNAYNDSGQYLIELIQSGGENTYTNKKRDVKHFDVSDLFFENDVFTAEEYSEFMLDGKMDSRDTFGYAVEVVSIDKVNDEYKAIIRVTRQ